MSVTTKEQKHYLKQIKRLLVCKPSEQKKFLLSLSDSMEEYMKAHPKATIEQLKADLGSPTEIAEEFLANESPERIKKHMLIAKWIKIGIAVALLLIAITLGLALIDAYKNQRGYGEEGPAVEVSISEEQIFEN